MLDKIYPKFIKNQLFAVDIKILHFIGFWPEQMVNFRSIILFISSCLLEVFPEIFFIIKNRSNIQKVFMCLHELISFMVYVTKVMILFLTRKKITSLIHLIKLEWEKCKMIEIHIISIII